MHLDRRLLRLAWQHRLWLILSIVLGVAGGGLAAVQAGLLSQVVACAHMGGAHLGHASLAELAGFLLALLAVILLRFTLTWSAESSANALARRIKPGLRLALAEKLAEQPGAGLAPASPDETHSGGVHTLAVEGIDALDAYYSQYLPALAQAGLVPLILLLFVFPIDPLSGLVLLLTGPLIPLFMLLIGSWAAALTRRQWTALSRMSAYFLDVLRGLPTLRALGRSRAQVKVMRQVSEQFRLATLRVLRVTFLSALALEWLATLSTAVVAVQVGLRLLYGHIEFAPAFFVLILAPEYYAPLRSLGARFHAGMNATSIAPRLFALLEAPERRARGRGTGVAQRRWRRGEFFIRRRGETEIRRRALYKHLRFCASPRLWIKPTAFQTSLPSPTHIPSAPQIRFERVSFRYPAAAAAVLRGLSVELPAGRTTFLNAPSGAGKSTLAALLLGLAQPDSGRILVNGQELSTLTTEAWRARIAWLPQNPTLFYGTVADNLRLARPDASDAEVEQAARQAEAHAFISALPDGYHTRLGEGGLRLSGGQRQRLALARAFLRQADVIILDEPTAHLDAESEAAITRALPRLLAGRTALVITHRPSWLPDDTALSHPLDAPRPVPPETLPDGEQDAERPAEGPHAERGSQGREIVRLLALLRPHWALVLLSVLAGAGTVLSGVGLMFASAYILSAAALHPSVAVLQVAIVGVRAFGLARGGLRYAERYLTHDVTFHLLTELRVRFYAALEPLSPARLLQRRSGDLLARLVGDISQLEQFYVRAIAPPGAAVLTAVGMSWLLGGYAPSLALAWLLLFALGGGLLPLWARRLGRPAGQQVIAARGALSAAWVEGLAGLAELRLLGRTDRWLGPLAQHSRTLAAAQQRLADLAALQNALTVALGHVALWLVLVLGLPLVTEGTLPSVYLAGLALAALAGYEAVLPLPMAGQTWETSHRAAVRLFEVMDMPPAVNDPISPLPLPADTHLQAEQLSFRYPGESAWALQEVSFSLPPGKRMAIVGPSGAGKSTLVNLLLRFWEYEHGRLRLGGCDLRLLAQDAVRSRLAVAGQSADLFNASLADNLRLAYPAASTGDMEQVLRLARLSERALAAPEGLAAWVGEGGIKLSGGERQRLALARALLRLRAQPASVLILDEPFAHLDTPTAQAALANVLAHLDGCSLLLITHRLAGLETMDEILVLEAGRIVERGRHAELLARDGRYAALSRAQHAQHAH